MSMTKSATAIYSTTTNLLESDSQNRVMILVSSLLVCTYTPSELKVASTLESTQYARQFVIQIGCPCRTPD